MVNYIPDAEAWQFLRDNVPLFACPDPSVEELYYYRWWAYRKHIKKTPAGFIVTEFLKPVKHAAEYNAISCAFGHHIAEGRWLHDPRYLDDYTNFWLRSGPDGGLHPRFHQFSGWAADAVYGRFLADRRRDRAIALLTALERDYRAWEHERQLASGLFWQTGVADGMEESISGGRHVKNARPSINSYMYGNAQAIAAIARLAGKAAVEQEYEQKAGRLRGLVETLLWNPADQFFETLLENGKLAGVREEIGFTPWMFHLPETGRKYERAWAQIVDPEGFSAPYGITTAERRSPGFRIANTGDECQWNGPSWPFSTTITLNALANVLRDYPQSTVTHDDYFATFLAYSRGQHLKTSNGEIVPFIDENLNPFTGEWQARAMKIRNGAFYARGDHYNHSTYADLVITGLAGLVPRADNTVEVDPLVPKRAWDWFCVDNIPYHGRTVTILWDRNGTKFRRGKGLRIFANGHEIAHAPDLRRLEAALPSTTSGKN